MLHGVRLKEDNSKFVPPIRIEGSRVIALYGEFSGSAKDIDSVRNREEAKNKYGTDLTDGTVAASLEAIYSQVTNQPVVVVKKKPVVTPTEAVTPSKAKSKAAKEAAAAAAAENPSYEGIFSIKRAVSATGLEPTILVAPNFSSDRPTAEALGVIAADLKAIAVVDGKNTTTQETIDYRKTLSESGRVLVVDPYVTVAGTQSIGASAAIAGLITRVDYEEGFWVSPSNKPLRNIEPDRAISWGISDESSEANLLNQNQVSTIINNGFGYRFWGNRGIAQPTDPYTFISVRRTADVINESIIRSSQWAVDRNINKSFVTQVLEQVNNFMRDLKGLGAIIDGRCFIDPQNSVSNIKQGKVFFRYNFTPNYPAEEITFTVAVSEDGLEEILNAV